MSSFVKTKYIQCIKCRGKPGPRDQPGFYYTQMGTVVECSCHKDWVGKNKLALSAGRANLPEEFFDFDPRRDYAGQLSRDQMEKLVLFVEKFDEIEELRSQSIYITGISETQKTFLAKWMGCALLKKGYTVAYMKMKDIVKSIMPDFNDQEQKDQSLDRLLSLDVLIIDDAFKDKITEFKSAQIENFLKERIEDLGRSVFFVSFIPPGKIKTRGFPDSLQNFVIRVTEKQKGLFIMKDIYDRAPIKDVDNLLRGSHGK